MSLYRTRSVVHGHKCRNGSLSIYESNVSFTMYESNVSLSIYECQFL